MKNAHFTSNSDLDHNRDAAGEIPELGLSLAASFSPGTRTGDFSHCAGGESA